MKKLFTILFLALAVSGFGQAPSVKRNSNTTNDFTYELVAESVQQWTNQYNVANSAIAANSALRFRIKVNAGTYAFTGDYSFYPTNNIEFVAGRNGVKVTTDKSLVSSDPWIVVGNNFTLDGFTVETSGSAFTKFLGVKTSDRQPYGNSYSATNWTARNCSFLGDDDCFYFDATGAPPPLRGRIENCIFRSKYDTLLMSAAAPFSLYGILDFVDDRWFLEYYNCVFEVKGPCTSSQANKGTTSCINISGFANVNFWNCNIDSRDATNLTTCMILGCNPLGTPLFDSSTNGAPQVNFYGGKLRASSTNIVAGGGIVGITNISARVGLYNCDIGTNSLIGVSNGLFIANGPEGRILNDIGSISRRPPTNTVATYAVKRNARTKFAYKDDGDNEYVLDFGSLTADQYLVAHSSGTLTNDTLTRVASALSMLGRSANSTGARADITAGADGLFLGRSNSTLLFLNTPGYTMQFYGNILGFSPADGIIYFPGMMRSDTVTNYANNRVKVPKAGTLKRVDWVWQSITTQGTGETVNLYVRLNDTTDCCNIATTIDQTVATQTIATWTGTQAVSTGDDICGKMASPTWATNPAGLKIDVFLYIE